MFSMLFRLSCENILLGMEIETQTHKVVVGSPQDESIQIHTHFLKTYIRIRAHTLKSQR